MGSREDGRWFFGECGLGRFFLDSIFVCLEEVWGCRWERWSEVVVGFDGMKKMVFLKKKID